VLNLGRNLWREGKLDNLEELLQVQVLLRGNNICGTCQPGKGLDGF
jgi:hypothetical protein